MRIWGADGALQLDENSFTMRVVFSALVSFNSNPSSPKSSQDFSVPGLTPSNGTAFVVPVADYGSTITQFETEVLNGVVRVYNWNRGFSAGTWTSSAGTMRLIVIRFS
ncbi:hypothetical protein N5D61_24740 [Pseudomonas sp. GD03842]|uniref:hypothetical protein n=1 Tax=Pseudomonas sp. GD03842 TaxID=2975385 RepID=UPI00244B596D|nr:hypothetical protein [Pseudomonas sp. GD03842]MDH0749537.1 hypothetical protein [Pseudomonas sp. GD03842]